MDSNDEISLQDLIYVVIKGWKVIFISTFIFIALTLVYVNLPISKENIYETNASMVINSKTYIINKEIEVSGENNIYLSQKMVNTYRVILLSDNVLERVRHKY